MNKTCIMNGNKGPKKPGPNRVKSNQTIFSWSVCLKQPILYKLLFLPPTVPLRSVLNVSHSYVKLTGLYIICSVNTSVVFLLFYFKCPNQNTCFVSR